MVYQDVYYHSGVLGSVLSEWCIWQYTIRMVKQEV